MPTVEAGRANKPGRLMQPLIREYVSKLPPETVQTYRRTFNQFDRNRSGTVDVRELGVMFRALRQFPTEDDLRVRARRGTARARGCASRGRESGRIGTCIRAARPPVPMPAR
jgi:hypothetical protein